MNVEHTKPQTSLNLGGRNHICTAVDKNRTKCQNLCFIPMTRFSLRSGHNDSRNMYVKSQTISELGHIGTTTKSNTQTKEKETKSKCKQPLWNQEISFHPDVCRPTSIYLFQIYASHKQETHAFKPFSHNVQCISPYPLWCTNHCNTVGS